MALGGIQKGMSVLFVKVPILCMHQKNTICHSSLLPRLICIFFCVCVRACACVRTINVIVIKLGTVTASNTRMHHVLIRLTLTFIQGHTDLNHELINV